MPFEVMDQRGVSASSHCFEEISFTSEKVGCLEPKGMPHHRGMKGMVTTPGSLLDALPYLEKLSPIGAQSVDTLELPQSIPRDQRKKIGSGGEEADLSNASWKSVNQHMESWSNVCMQQLPSHSLDRKKTVISGTKHESSLFSSSLSEIFSGKLGILGNEFPSHQPASAVFSHHDEELFESIEELEAQTTGNFLPDEDDLFSGMIDELGCSTHDNSGDDFEDFDLFSSGGGMELEGDDRMYMGQKNFDYIRGLSNGQVGSNSSILGEHPSRTLFVRNINSNVEESELKAFFEQHGDIRTLYTACRHRGFVMISYYDIRAAQNAKRELQNKPLKCRKLDIHYSIPKDNPSERDINQGTLAVFNLDSSVSDDELRQIFGFYGEIKEIFDIPHKCHPKFIEFYDVRAAESALRALNKSDIPGKQIKVEPSHPGIARWRVMEQFEQEQGGRNVCQSPCKTLSPVCTDNGSNHSLHSAARSPVSSYVENVFPHRSSGVLNNFSSPVRVASIGKQFGICDSKQSLNEIKFSNQCIPSFHPHSFPDYLDSSVNGSPCKISSHIADMAVSLGPKVAEGIDSRKIIKVSSNIRTMEPNAGVFGSSGNGSYPLHGHHHFTWNSCNSYQQHPSSPMIWGDSPSFATGVPAHHLPHMPGFPRGSHQLLNMSTVHCHVGSAPAVNPSLWDRRHSYLGESPEASGFHLGSLGSVGFPCSSQLHPIETSSRSTFSHVGRNCPDMLTNAGHHSQQMCHIFPEPIPMISMPTSFESPSERARSLSHHRNEANYLADKKQFELDIDRILRGEDGRTTLMIKNIPNKYTSKMLLVAIDEHCRGTYDFIYLPIDFKNKCNVGYAFINMTNPRQIISFHQAFNGKKWEKFNSEKVASLAYARIQGKAALIAHFQNSSLMNEDKRCRPILFHTDGPNAGDLEPFPMGANIRSRPGRPRTNGNEENHNQGSPSTFANREEYSNGSDFSKDFD